MTQDPASPRRLLFLIAGLGAGGAEAVLAQLVRGLDPRRFHCSIISFTPGGRHFEALQGEGRDVHHLGMRPGLPTPAGLQRMVRLARRLRPDALIGWMQHGNLAASLLRRLVPGSPALFWNVRQAMYSLDCEKRSQVMLIKLLRRLSRGPSAIVCNSAIAVEQLQKLGYHTERTQVIPNGFDTARYTPDAAARQALRQELGLPPDAFIIGRVGRNDAMKDNACFFHAMAGLAQGGGDFHIVMAGSGIHADRDPLASELRPHAAALAGRLHLLGERGDVPRVTAALDLSVSSSFTEGFPNVIGEAMACAVPVVSTDVGDSAALIADAGALVPARDAAALQSACRHIMDLPAAERQALGLRARARIIDHFSIERMIDRFQSLFSAPLTLSN